MVNETQCKDCGAKDFLSNTAEEKMCNNCGTRQTEEAADLTDEQVEVRAHNLIDNYMTTEELKENLKYYISELNREDQMEFGGMN